MDLHTPEQRRFNMSRVRSKDTGPEMLLRTALYARGFRYRLHYRELPGRPDLVFPRLRAVMFINGCFWHGHGCSRSKLPATKREFWTAKIAANQVRDQRNIDELIKAGWKTLVVWECSLRGPTRKPLDEVLDTIARWLRSGDGCQLSI
jgi:DNA mismatch endonuclease (patch repair protein)